MSICRTQQCHAFIPPHGSTLKVCEKLFLQTTKISQFITRSLLKFQLRHYSCLHNSCSLLKMLARVYYGEIYKVHDQIKIITFHHHPSSLFIFLIHKSLVYYSYLKNIL